MAPVVPIRERQREDRFSVRSFLGRNTFGQHQSLEPGEFRDCVNWDLVRNGRGKEEMRSRRGSGFLRPAEDPEKWGAQEMPRAVTWDVGAEEYDISQVGTVLRFQCLTTPSNPETIGDFDEGPFGLGTGEPACLKVQGDRLFVFHPGGNKVVEWNGTTFRGRDMGMTWPYISNVSPGYGPNNGRWIYGIEKVYQVDGADILVSSPNRKKAGSEVLADTGSLVGVYITLTLAEASLSDTLWTHLRLWRTKSLVADTTDPENVIEAQGVEDELYEVALISREEMEADGLTAIATGEGLPPGNVGVLAGLVSGEYRILDQNRDDVLFNLVGLDRIELEPLPACTVGEYHANRMWVSGVNGSNDVLYSNAVGTKYSELYDPENVIETGRDGVAVTRMFSFERDLVVLKESKSLRLQGGDVDQEFETFDPLVGAASFDHAEYLPGLGIIAITNDDPALKLLGLDYRWTTMLNGMDFSLAIQEDVAAMDASRVRFLYHRGKILLSDGAGSIHVLHARFGRGWTRYVLPVDTGELLNLISFAGGTRAAIVSANAYTLEIDKAGVDTDDSIEDDTTGNDIPLSYVTHMYQSDDGKHLVEQEWYWMDGKLSAPMAAVPYLHGRPWPNLSTETETPFVVTPYTYTQDEFKDREYRLTLEPQRVGDFDWVPFAGMFLHYEFRTVAPAALRGHGMRAIVDESESSFDAFDPFGVVIGDESLLPTWESPVLLHLPFNEPTGDIARDISGHNRHHTWDGGADGTHAYDADMAPNGGRSAIGGEGSGYACLDWPALEYIGDDAGFNSEPLTFEFVVAVPSLAMDQGVYEIPGTEDGGYIRLLVKTDGSLEFQISTSEMEFAFSTASGIIEAGSDEYLIQFVLSNGGQNGQFYAGLRSGAFPGALLTTRAPL